LSNVNLHPEGINAIKQLLHEKYSIVLTDLQLNTESLEYGACSFKLNNKKMFYRVSKLTPVKAGQFVTIWKRNKEGVTEPYDISDDFEFLIIAAKSGNNLGYFIFPKYVLAQKAIVTTNEKQGKRGIRVYPPWDKVVSKQAEISQTWQTSYFHTISDVNSIKTDFISKLLFEAENYF
jgi:hypothetical protein